MIIDSVLELIELFHVVKLHIRMMRVVGMMEPQSVFSDQCSLFHHHHACVQTPGLALLLDQCQDQL